jgi:hypothetical protein
MSDNTQSFTLAVPTIDPTTIIQTQHGMRFPDGSIKWEQMSVAPGRTVVFAELSMTARFHSDKYWDAYLKEQAQAAKLDLAKFTAEHQLVKRTIVIVTTEVEDLPQPEPKDAQWQS